MIAEHEFVTTLEQDQACNASSQFLQGLGFTLSRTHNGFTASRGESKPSKAKRYDDLPQRVELNYDRGRCIVAASITPLRKPDELHQQIITHLLSSLEAVLVHHTPSADAMQLWVAIDRSIARKARSRRNKQITLWCVFIGIMSLVVALIIFAAINY